jgi:hypothetical protein
VRAPSERTDRLRIKRRQLRDAVEVPPKITRDVRGEAGADPVGADEAGTLAVADDQSSDPFAGAGRIRKAADDELLAQRALRLDLFAIAPPVVRKIATFGYDAVQVVPARQVEERGTWAHDMVRIPDAPIGLPLCQ